jgi:hypothetical protein
MAITEQEFDVYRIEDENGTGPYRKDWGGVYPNSAARHPTPTSDAALGFYGIHPGSLRDQYHFGFVSVAQLRFWFYRQDWLEALDKAGFRLTKWRVPAGLCRTSDAQAVFLRAQSIKVSTERLV